MHRLRPRLRPKATSRKCVQVFGAHSEVKEQLNRLLDHRLTRLAPAVMEKVEVCTHAESRATGSTS